MSPALFRSALVLAGWCVALRVSAAPPAAARSGDCDESRCLEFATMVRRAGDRVPVSDVRILIVPESEREAGDVPPRAHLRERDGSPPWIRQGTTDRDGRIAVGDVPAGRIRVIAIADGFERFERVIELDGRKRMPPLFIRELDRNPFRTVVSRPPAQVAPPPETTTHTLEREEIRTLPGTQGDPLRAVQNLPGIARAPAGAGLLVLRGAPPGQSRVFLGDHAVPRSFHILGFSSVIPADVIETLELVPGNYSARYGNALGGVISIQPRTARRDGVHGFAKVDLTSAGAMIETPIRRAGFFVAAQRGYVDAVLRLAEKVDETAVFALPRYYDYQAQFDVPMRDGAELIARVIGSGDSWTTRTIDFQGKREEVNELGDQFHRAEVVWRANRGPWRLLVTPAFRFEARRTSSEISDEKFRGYAVAWRFEAERRLSRRASLAVGADGDAMPFRGRSSLGVGDSAERRSTKGYDVALGLYAWSTIELGPVTLWPGVRVSAFTRSVDEELLGSAKSSAYVVDPRLLARFEPHERWTINAGVGAYSQAQPLSGSGSSGLLDGNQSLGGGVVVLPASARAAIDPGIGVGNLTANTRTNQAVQASLGAAWHDERGLEIGATTFVRWHEELRYGQSQMNDLAYPFDSEGLNYGLEVLVRKRLGKRFYAWAAYTLMRAQVRSPETPGSVGGVTPGNYDQRHNLVLLASYALPHGFRIGGRFRLVSGAPFTPVVGVINGDDVFNNGFGSRIPVNGATNSERFPTFHQLDLRLDKSWILRRSIVLAYVDVQNVYNHENVEAYIYARDFRERVGQVGLPILPTIGVRVEW